MTTQPPLNGHNSGMTLRTLLKENHIFHVAAWIFAAASVVVIVMLIVLHISVSRVVRAGEAGAYPDIRRFSERYDRLRSDLRATEHARQQLFGIRPVPSDLVRFIERLESAAVGRGIRLTVDAVPAEKDPAGQPYPVPIVRYSLILEGPLEGVIGTMEAIGRDPFLVRVETADLTSPNSEDLDRITSARITVAVAVREQTP